MIRKKVSIRPDQEQRLISISKERGISQSEVVRRALDDHFSGRTPFIRDLSAWKREMAFIDSLIARGPARGERSWERSDLY